MKNADELQQWLDAYGLSVRTGAAYCRIPTSTFSTWLYGERKIPKRKQIYLAYIRRFGHPSLHDFEGIDFELLLSQYMKKFGLPENALDPGSERTAA